MSSITDIQKEIAKIQWWHSIDLGNGVITPGKDASQKKLAQIRLDADLSGKSVLDIGAWDGFFSFAAENRGAKRVLATDSFVWLGKTWGSRDGFDFARKVLKSKVEDQTIDVMDLSPERTGSFDIVLFLGVLYHMRHPLMALERVASVTRNQLILESQVSRLWTKQPTMVFYPNNELDGDVTNWWGPNIQAIIAMLKTVGFREIRYVCQVLPFSKRLKRALFLRATNQNSFFDSLQRGRVVIHAYK